VKPPTVPTPDKQQSQTQAGAEQLENIRMISSVNVETFARDLTDKGKLGYRLEKSLNYGGASPTQRYVAVLRIDPGNTYDYTYLIDPDKKKLEAKLNDEAKTGFNFASAYIFTTCKENHLLDLMAPGTNTEVLRMRKSDAIILERKNGNRDQTMEYKVIIAKVHLGDGAEKNIQGQIDTAIPQGFRPVKILVSRQGTFDFNAIVVAERNLKEENTTKTEYRFIKAGDKGMVKDINDLAAQGFRFVNGTHFGLMALVLMAKQAGDGTAYTLVNSQKYDKEFDKIVAEGNSYQGRIEGDMICGSSTVENERFVFAQNAGEKRQYKIADLSLTPAGGLTEDSWSEFRRLMIDNYQIKDIFAPGGVHVIFET